MKILKNYLGGWGHVGWNAECGQKKSNCITKVMKEL